MIILSSAESANQKTLVWESRQESPLGEVLSLRGFGKGSSSCDQGWIFASIKHQKGSINRIRSPVFVNFLSPVKAYKAWEEAGAAPTEFKEEDRPVALMQIFKQKSLSGLFTDFTVVWCSLSCDRPCFWKCCFLELHEVLNKHCTWFLKRLG